MMRSNTTAVNHPKKKRETTTRYVFFEVFVRGEKGVLWHLFFFFWRRLEGGRPKIGTQKVPKKAPNDENISL